MKFTIAVAVPLHNEWMRMHWSAHRRAGRTFANMVRAGLYDATGCLTWNKPPLEQCEIIVERFTAYTRPPDVDAICVKPLLDALKPASRTCPYGLGIIEDDSPDVILKLTTRAHKCEKGKERTEMEIVEVAE